MSLGVGIVQLNESTDAREVPECGNGFVGYFTDGFIFDYENGESGRETKGTKKKKSLGEICSKHSSYCRIN